jgi:hypothetical protein
MRNRIVLTAATGLLAIGGLGFSSAIASAQPTPGPVGSPSPNSSCVAFFNSTIGQPAGFGGAGVSFVAQEPHVASACFIP